MNWQSLQEICDQKGMDFVYYPEVGSTQTAGKERIQAGNLRSALIVAGRQTDGKGRRGNVWESGNEKGLWASLVLPGKDGAMERPLHVLCVAIGLAVAKYVRGVSLKWPNDVLIGEKKVAGVLAEFESAPGGNQGLILGFGLNLFQTPNDFSPQIRAIATSLQLAGGMNVSLETMAREILGYFFEWKSKTAEGLHGQYVSMLSSLGRECELDGKRIYAKGVIPDGGLVAVDLTTQKENIVYSGTLRHA